MATSSGFDAGQLIQFAAAGMQAVGSAQAARAQRNAARYSAAVSRSNAQIAEWQARSIVEKGNRELSAQRLRTAQALSAQRTRLAANGIAVDEGSALNLLHDTEYLGELDANTIKDNTAREEWGARVQQTSYLNDAEMADSTADGISPGFAAATSLLGNAGQVASSWYKRKKVTRGT
jgi:hypothetical protein